MKSFKLFYELYQNEIKSGHRFHDSPLGVKPHPDAKHIGTLSNGDKVYHRASHHDSGSSHHYYVTGKSGKTNIHLTTYQDKGHKAEEIGILNANKSSAGAHKLYQHLVTKHDKILTSDDQSAGARKVWHKAGQHPQVNIHGFDGKRAIHAKPDEEEHYVKSGEIHRHTLDALGQSKTKTKKHMADIEDIKKAGHVKLVMHKK